MSYVTSAEYTQLGFDSITQDLDKKLGEASNRIDLLTYNMIKRRGIEKLTNYQKDVVKKCVCELADFYDTNSDMVNSALQAYSINGVSMSFGNTWNIAIKQGIAINRDTYMRLLSTGLCGRVIG